MEKKNKKILLIVGVLLLLGGISYAYFTGVSTFNGSGDKVEGITATVKGSEVIVSGNLEFNDLDILPGHKNISSIKLTATGNAELLPYNLIWNGTNGLNTPLNYTVYKTGEKIETSANCEKKQEALGADTIYYEECTITNLEKLGTKLSEGTIKANTTNTKEILAENEFITATSEGTSIYYYVVLEYPNLDEDQNADIGGSFKGTVTVEESNAKPDINILAVKIEQEDGTYKDSEDIPQTGYTLNVEKSVCSNGATPTGLIPNITVNNLTKNGTNCYLYFDLPQSSAQVLSKLGIIAKNETPDFSKAATTDEGVFKTQDDDGDTYYFRGAVENNYVKFADKYWRIIRINGDGSIRIILNDSIEKSAFNSNKDNNMYVGFKYTSESVHGIEENSTILYVLDKWYTYNLLNYSSKLDANAGFCGDRTPSTSKTISNGLGGTKYITTYYGAYIRLLTNKSPVLTCLNEDFYTSGTSSKGNKSLVYPIGLITADEVAMAGGVRTEANKDFYLYNNLDFWTISPSCWEQGTVVSRSVFGFNSNGILSNVDLTMEFGVRPVINLRADIELTGTGTMTDPYVVVGGNS